MNLNHKTEKLIKKKELHTFKEFIAVLGRHEGKILLQNDLLLIFKDFCAEKNLKDAFMEDSSVAAFLKRIQEMIIRKEYIALMYRHGIGKYRFYMLRQYGEYMEIMAPGEYLDIKDTQVFSEEKVVTPLHIDFMPFYDFSPSIRDTRSVGNGIRYLNRYLSSHLFQNPKEWNEKLFSFIKMHSHNGYQLLVNGGILTDFDDFYEALEGMIETLSRESEETPYSRIEPRLKKAGFEPGWGNTAGRIVKTMQLLYDLINEPDDSLLEAFIARVPMPHISKIAIISPHGWFGQEHVLGKPDTGGQVIYILDQVRALEKYLKESLRLSGLDFDPRIIVITRLIPEAGDTTCDQKHEKIHGTKNGWILRIPFRDEHHQVIPHWISRFQVWPYLEQFAEDAAFAVQSEFEGKPDLIIGNYSDGNLVASLMSDALDVTQCTIAHALEKTKYLFSDLYWKNVEDHYHFSLQFTADMIAMNKSDFIIASTHQEIIGTETEMGQYESYQNFTLPGLYQVINGINLFAPKFNVIPPGVDERIYFPYYESDKRIQEHTRTWENRIFTDPAVDIYGRLDNPDKRPIFTMARFDKVKNITGLIEAFGQSNALRESCNLIFSAGSIRIEESKDDEEREEIHRAYELIGKYDLHGQVRWLPSINKQDTGEVYRIIADKKGIFVQPAHFEAFGLTILEAMVSGLPTFGPKFGGPSEIIEPGKSGFLMNTSKPQLIAESLETFLESCKKDTELWKTISENGIKRVNTYFTWALYSEKLITLAKLYGFWRFSESAEGKVKLNRYTDLIYHFLFRQRAIQGE